MGLKKLENHSQSNRSTFYEDCRLEHKVPVGKNLKAGQKTIRMNCQLQDLMAKGQIRSYKR